MPTMFQLNLSGQFTSNFKRYETYQQTDFINGDLYNNN
jgi:hypothetical protein